jgi:aminoglycoside phosphotransferase (APT) family kinase protein
VHGDFHPGNVCGTEQSLVLLDWGDCGVGHPMLDQAAFLQRRTDAERAVLAGHWADAWRAAAPGSDPERAAQLIGPVAALRQAVIYRLFLDSIEDDEKVYHAADPPDWLRRTAALVAQSS